MQSPLSSQKLFLGVVMVAILALALIWLQRQFDEGDYRRAIELLHSKAPQSRWSINEELVLRAGQAVPTCEPKLLSSFQGTLEVTCHAGPGQPYRFGVDLVRRHVHGLDDHSISLIDVVAAKARGAVVDGGMPVPQSATPSPAPDGGSAANTGDGGQ